MSETKFFEAEKTFSGHTKRVSALAKVDDKTFISGSWDKTIKLWNIDMDTPLRTYNYTRSVSALAVFPDKEHFISGGCNVTIKLWKIDSDTPERTYTGHTDYVRALAVLDSQTFISGSDDMTIKLWNIDKTTALRTYNTTGKIVNALAVFPDKKRFISGSKGVGFRREGDTKVWEIDKNRPTLLHSYSSGVEAVAVLGNDKYIQSVNDNEISLWRFGQYNPERRYYSYSSDALAVFPDKKHFISVSSKHIILWNIDNDTPELTYTPYSQLTYTHERIYKGHTGDVEALAVLDSQTFISGSSDNTIKLWRYFEPALEPEVTKKLGNRIGEYPSLHTQGFVGTRDGYFSRFLFKNESRGGKRRNKKSKNKRSNKKKYRKTRRKSRKI